MTKEKLMFQMFIGKVSEEIGFDKTYELLKESQQFAEHQIKIIDELNKIKS